MIDLPGGAAARVLALALGLALDAAIGDPSFDWHPVRLIGRLAARAEAHARRLNAPSAGPCVPGGRRSRRLVAAGALAWAVVMAASIAAALLLERAASAAHPALGLAAGALIVWASVAPRDLARHALRVKAALEADLAEGAAEPRRGRAAVAMLVGRDVSRLDYAGVARACVESVAESSVDGAAAPLFWALLLGPWGGFAYRAANTMDSMFGHKDGRYYSFGLVAARADDALNWAPARIGGLLACFAAPAVGGKLGPALRAFVKYRAAHESPNAGHPEAAYAGALGLRLGGPTAYAEGVVDKPWMLPEGRDAGPEDIGRALRLLALQLTLVFALPAAALLAAA